MSLFRLVYASTSLLGDEPDLAREQIEQILLVSRRNNEAAETGCGSPAEARRLLALMARTLSRG
jgi:hypothetical protein